MKTILQTPVRVALLMLAIFGGVAAMGASKPNIIFVLVDDLGFGDVGAFYQNGRREAGNRSKPWHSTPALDAMAAEGAKLMDHYCAAPVCAPSRASLLTGVHQGHSTVRNNEFEKELENSHTLATVLKTAGYSTWCVGKWGLAGKGNDPKTMPAYPTKRGFDYYMGYVRHRDGHEHYPKEGPYKGPKKVWENNGEISAGLDKCYTADLFTARAKKLITDQRATNAAKPFFLYLAYDTPHATDELPTQAYPEGRGLKGGMQWLGERGHMINTASGKVDSWCYPEYVNATYDDDGDPKTAEKPWPDVYKRYASAVRRLDDCVGDLLQLLRDLKIETNTLVVFSSDNGPSIESYLPQALSANFFNSFGPFDGIKRDVWEGGLRVPTIAWWPGTIPAGQIVTTPSQSQDWLATFADASGLATPARCDGVSLLPCLTGKGQQRESTVYCEYYHDGKTPSYPEFAPEHRGRDRKEMQSVRIGKFEGVRYNVTSPSSDFEIYDVEADPGQRVNLAANGKLAELQTRLKETVLRVRRPSATQARPYDGEYVPSVKKTTAVAGVEWRGFEGKFPWVPQLDGAAETSRGVAGTPEAAVTAAAPTATAMEITGYVNAPADGDYTFYLNADKRAVLRIHEARVIDADYGYEPGQEKSGTIRLKSGRHPFRLYYMRQSKGAALVKLSWSGPGIEKGLVPESALFHEDHALENGGPLR